MGVVRCLPGQTYTVPDGERELALAWLLDGPGVLHYRDGDHVLPIGSVLLIPQWVDHSYTWDSARVTHQGFVTFYCDPLPEVMKLRHLPATDVVTALLNHILWLDAHRPHEWREHATKALEYACAAFFSGNSGTERHTSFFTSEAVSRIVDHVKEAWGDLTFTRSFTLNELAEVARITPQSLCRLFERELGVGPVECFRLLQLKRAATYLDQTDLRIAEIAARAGYSDETAFSRAFKRASGVSPRSFRTNSSLEFTLPVGVRRVVYSPLLA